MNAEPTEQEEVEIEPQHSPVNGIEFRKTFPCGTIVIGYRTADEHCSNPCTDSDGMGHVRSFDSRHINNINPDEAMALLDRDPMIVPLAYYEHGQSSWMVAGGEEWQRTPDKQWDGRSFGGVWIPDDCCREEIQIRLMNKSLPDGVKVEYKSTPKKSNVITLTIPALHEGYTRGGYKSFVHAYNAALRHFGVKIYMSAPKTFFTIRDIATELAAVTCKEYTSWCNGDCYCTHIETYHEDGTLLGEDTCGGYIGDYSLEALEESFNAVKEPDLEFSI